MNNSSNTNNWKNAHNKAMKTPNNKERMIVDTLNLLNHLRSRDMVDDYFFNDHFVNILKAGRAALNYDIGRLDAGTCDREFCNMAKEVGYDLDRDLWTK